MNTYTSQLVSSLKDNQQDFEWYPTTREMILAVSRCIPSDADSILDIGAGDGQVLVQLAEKLTYPKLYSIEKSSILIQSQPKEVIPIGAEFFEQNLWAIPVDYIFCNPPFLQFEDWARKIIVEGFSKKSFLVLPQRWKDSDIIRKAIKERGASTRVVYTGDFQSGDRRSRAVIDIVEVSSPREEYGNRVKDPFDIWFDQNVDTFDKAVPFEESEAGKVLARRLSHASIPEMVESYLTEYKLLETNYRSIFKLDFEILRELGVNKENVREGLKKKMADLKIKYWEILFNRLDAITSRLTTRSKKSLLEKLTGNTSVEFTATNAYSVVLWAIKNANQYFDDQLIQLFYDLTTFEGALQYKSNVRAWEKDGWRFNHDKKYTHYKLDYRIVVSEWKAIKNEQYSDYEYPGDLHRNCHAVIADIIAVLSNLGFSSYSSPSYDRAWDAGKWQDWYGNDDEILFQVKAYKNGNLHLRFTPEAIKALNIQVGRLLKWVRTEEDVVDEMNYSREDARKYFNHNSKILPANMPLLAGSNQ